MLFIIRFNNPLLVSLSLVYWSLFLALYRDLSLCTKSMEIEDLDPHDFYYLTAWVRTSGDISSGDACVPTRPAEGTKEAVACKHGRRTEIESEVGKSPPFK